MTENIGGIPETPTSPIAIEFKEYIESIHPRTDWREYLDFLIVVGQYYDEYGESPRTGDLTHILQYTDDKVRRRAEPMEGRYIRIERPPRGGAYISIDSKRYYDFDELQEEFESILADLEAFLMQHLQDIDDPDLRTAINVLHADILEHRDNIFRAVSKYEALVWKLKCSGIQHNLRDAQVQNMANRYVLTIQGEEIFLAWQRGEFHERQPGRAEGTYPGS